MALYKYTYYYYYYNNNNDNRQSQNKRHHNNPVRTACAAVQHYNAPIHITMHNTTHSSSTLLLPTSQSQMCPQAGQEGKTIRTQPLH